MSRIVRVSDPNYKLSVHPGGTITLDTGDELGQVVVTGDLVVKGNTFTIDSETLSIRDNIIVVNAGEEGAGVTAGIGGIEIDRGTQPNAQILYDEAITRFDPESNSQVTGAVSFKYVDGTSLGIAASSVVFGHGLSLVGSASGVLTVKSGADYASLVLHDDDIPNKKYTENRIVELFNTTALKKIGENDSVLIMSDIGAGSSLTLTLDSDFEASWTAARHLVQDIRISGSKIDVTSENGNLAFAANGTGAVAVESPMVLSSQTTTPALSLTGVKLYSSLEKFGGSGVYFVTPTNTRDELVSRRRALAFSLIF